MSMCDVSRDLVESYGVLEVNGTFSNISDPVFSHWCRFEPVSNIVHIVVGVVLVLIGAACLLGNLVVVVVFAKYRRLRSPSNTLILNLAISDMLNGFMHPMAAHASFVHEWTFGKIGCELYAALCGLFGLVSIMTLTAIAVERFLVISVKPLYGTGALLTMAGARIACSAIWIYSVILMAPPLFDWWGALVPEAFLTSCSFDYLTRTPGNRSYFVFLFFFGFVLPVGVICVCYSFILRTIRINERDLRRNQVHKVSSKKIRRRNDYKAAEMIIIVIVVFVTSWTPYSLVACIGQFGNTDILSPGVTIWPCLFAKMSAVYNPIIYGRWHHHFRSAIGRILGNTRESDISENVSRIKFRTIQCKFCACCNESTSEIGGTAYPKMQTLCPCLPNYDTASQTCSAALTKQRKLVCSCLPANVTSSFDDSSTVRVKSEFLGTNKNFRDSKTVYVKKTYSVRTIIAHSNDALCRELRLRSETDRAKDVFSDATIQPSLSKVDIKKDSDETDSTRSQLCMENGEPTRDNSDLSLLDSKEFPNDHEANNMTDQDGSNRCLAHVVGNINSDKTIIERPTALALKQNVTVRKFLRSLAFRSEYSIHQKYQMLIEEDKIVKVPTVVCMPTRCLLENQGRNTEPNSSNGTMPKYYTDLRSAPTGTPKLLTMFRV